MVSVLHANLSCRVGLVLSCFYKVTLVVLHLGENGTAVK